MSLQMAVKALIKLRNTNDSSELQWNVCKTNLRNEIEKQRDNSSLKNALDLDSNDVLPFDEKKLIYEKLLALDRDNNILKEFGWWLQMNGGPDFDKLAESLLQESEKFSR
jgi:hypothetical protein